MRSRLQSNFLFNKKDEFLIIQFIVGIYFALIVLVIIHIKQHKEENGYISNEK